MNLNTRTFIKPTLAKIILFVILGGYFSFFSTSIVQPKCSYPDCSTMRLCPTFKECLMNKGNPIPTFQMERSYWNVPTNTFWGQFEGALKFPYILWMTANLTIWYIVSCLLLLLFQKRRDHEIIIKSSNTKLDI
jgi:hypothetical protein